MQSKPAFIEIEKAAGSLLLAFFNQDEVYTYPSCALIQDSIYDDFMKVVTKRSIKRGASLGFL